ncbi:MAG: DUF881 domain-containing protein [Propionibacteriaceae bacterium]|nr:DUF881 domain-containing protein [Propionibacteriaceae bacterium]
MPEAPDQRVRPGFWRSFLRPGRGQLIVGALLCVTALLVVWTLRSQASRPDYSTLRRDDLVQLLDNLTAETRRLEAEARELSTTRDELRSGVAGAKQADEEAQRRIARLQIIAGTVPAHGPGIRITIEDPSEKITPELLLDALEEMRDAGGEVIEFNDSIRVVTGTWVGRDSQGRLTVDGTVVTAPIHIDVIGDAATLEAGARFRGGLVSQVEGSRVQGRVTISQQENLEISSTVTPEEPQFAKPK